MTSMYETVTVSLLDISDLSNTFTGFIKVHILPILAVHPNGILGGFPFTIHLKFKLANAVKQLGKMASHLKIYIKGNYTSVDK